MNRATRGARRAPCAVRPWLDVPDPGWGSVLGNTLELAGAPAWLPVRVSGHTAGSPLPRAVQPR